MTLTHSPNELNLPWCLIYGMTVSGLIYVLMRGWIALAYGVM